MSINAKPPRIDHELDAVIARAGAVRCDRHGRPVTLHYGSAAGELAACVARVGLSDRSELVKLVLTGPAPLLAHAVLRLTGVTLAPGGALRTGSVWWCAPTAERVIVLAEPEAGDHLHTRLRRVVQGHPALRIRDRREHWSAIAIVGGQAGRVLARLGIYGKTGDPRSAAPVSVQPVAGVDVTWLLESDHRALALMGHADAPAVWHALHATGQHFGICAVGQQALARYTLLARTHAEG